MSFPSLQNILENLLAVHGGEYKDVEGMHEEA